MTKTTPIRFNKFKNDPIEVHQYTLSNGMQLLLSVNTDAPRIHTNITVRAGSKHDPAETTGLAHYLEHMMFKGTSKVGALDWKKEKVLLEKLAALYEQLRKTPAAKDRKKIFKEIDQVSNKAADLVAANEYDKLVSVLGAEKTNAYTWLEQTVYVNDIPYNELERWMELEAERFKMVVLRLFHTELETVYEEFNINQDKDFRKVFKVINEGLFPTHAYSQTTIGQADHLKNPSHVKIKEFFSNYYRPNNMALVMSGDFVPEEVVHLAEKYFGKLEAAPIPKYEFETQAEIKEVKREVVFGQGAAYIQLAWRFGGASSKDIPFFHLLKGILYNEKAGLIDLNLIKQQSLLDAYTYFSEHEDYSMFMMYGKPREGQSLEAVEELLLRQIELIKNGDFDDWLMAAVVKDYKYREMKSLESNKARVDALTNAFTLGISWDEVVNLFNQMEAISKNDLIKFVRKRFKKNYIAVQKLTGEDKNIVKVDKPEITPLKVNRTSGSAFFKKFIKKKTESLEPVFVDFKNEIQSATLKKGVKLSVVRNPHNATFSLRYIFEMGKNSSKLLSLAIHYLPYLGTKKYTAEALQIAFFKLGLSFGVNASSNRVYVKLDGLEESLEEGVALFEHILSQVVGDEEKLKSLIQDVLTSRVDSKKSKDIVLRKGLVSFGYYGANSPLVNRFSEQELLSIKPKTLVTILKGLTNFEHHIYYYGQKSIGDVQKVLNKFHKVPKKLEPVLAPRAFYEVSTTENKVYIVHFPMVQTEILMMSRGTVHYDEDESIMGALWNEYFGIGMSSIVFQEIRESKGFAYSTYAYFRTPTEKKYAHYIQAFVGTQPDKVKDAVSTLRKIIEKMPVQKEAIEAARKTLLKKIETERIAPDSFFWEAAANEKLGIEGDFRKRKYEKLLQITPQDLIDFQKEKIKNRKFTFLVLGDEKQMDMKYLKSIGKIEHLDLKTLFGY